MEIRGITLKQALQKAKIKQEEAAIRLGISRPTLSVWCNKDYLSEDSITLVKTKLGIDLTNISEFQASDTPITNNPSINKENKGVPYFDIDFIGGFDLVFNSHQVNPSFYIDFLPFNDADYWVNVTGKSMGPLIAHGDIIALKEVKEWKRFLLEGEIYAILTDNGFRTVKIIGKGPDNDHFMLIPYNKSEDYNPQPIPKDVITHVFRVKGAIKKFF
ncbi:hypothetical protein SAMN05421821_105185 [Mucilaginibacter lappiensis]|uniref:Phage repressor protein C with HTH and peptisase S24 domain n=1 Tax=Mucilaginibacter lappiensis TaxID=354630 RepID=A0ABR6PJ28_9SPHI|nr:XRE family transcriptional regulator [Mucilaginibacter lappiensis]MBB6109767.1 phage repressor protein C with HTH and peptisase S24 domain [Mucilaginibacter lappiensis]SIR14848.1 hypothetical protein SAMN05421821_105185 [Mucilaginibacter lappiensis]